MPSIVIPAHNEESVIGRCLSSLLADAEPGELEVVVACNGCTDRTEKIVRQFHPDVRVLSTPEASKTSALNLGDAAATRFPRFYVDADVLLSIDAVRRVTAVLNEGEVLAAAPRMETDLSGRRWSIRAFYRVWLDLPYCRGAMIGSGVYAVSREGRARFTVFPPVTADDAFVRLQFAPHERRIVHSCSFTIRPPRALPDLIAIKTRAHFGNLELSSQLPGLFRNEEAGHTRALAKLAWHPSRWPEIALYVLVRTIARRRARLQFQSGRARRWERDESSRRDLTSPGATV